MDYYESLSGYAAELRAQHASPATLKAYINSVRRYLAWAGEHPLSVESIYQYRSYLSHYPPATVRAYVGNVSLWLDWLVRRGAIPANPARDVRLPKLGAPSRAVFTGAEVSRMLAAGEALRGADRARWGVVSVLGFLCGLRSGEILALAVDDIDITGRQVVVRHGKGDKRRVVPLPESALPRFAAWWHFRRRSTVRQYLGLRREWRYFALSGLFRRALAAAEIDRPGLTPHAMRHAAITLWAQAGNLADAQQLAGHADIATTARYVHPASERLRQVAALAAARAAGKQRERPRSWYREQRHHRRAA